MIELITLFYVLAFAGTFLLKILTNLTKEIK